MFVKSAVINFLVSTTHYSNMAAKIYRHEPPPNHTTSYPGSSRFPIWRRGVQEHSRITWSICAVLDRIKWKSKPPSPRNQGWSRAKAKTRHFLTLDLWGGEGAGGGGGYKFSICFFQGWSSPERFGANFGARQEKLRKESLQLRLWNSNSLSNREEKSLRHVAMVAKFLDDNKTKTPLKKWIRTVSKFIDFIQFHLICKILAKLSGVESERTVSELRKRKRNSCAVFTSLGSWRYCVVVEWDLAVTSGVSREK